MLALRPGPLVEETLERALAGDELGANDGYRLIEAGPEALPALMAAADALRARGQGRRCTYSRKVFIPLTNLCRDRCAYCTFAKPPASKDAHTMTPDEVLAVARAGARAGCKEALFSLGERPELRYPTMGRQLQGLGYATTIEYLAAMCELVYRETGLLPHSNPGTLTEDEMALLRPWNVSMGMMLESTSVRLHERGGAHWRCPDKLPDLRLATIAAAGRLNVAFTTGMLIGIGETPRERVDTLVAIREANREHGQVQEVIVQNFRAKPRTRMAGCTEPGLEDMLRTLAVARLLLAPVMSVQAPPNLMPEEYGRYLEAGINDWGGISPVTLDWINPEAAWPKLAEVKAVIERHGREPRERLAIYPEYITRRTEFVPERFWPALRRWADADGYVRMEETRW